MEAILASMHSTDSPPASAEGPMALADQAFARSRALEAEEAPRRARLAQRFQDLLESIRRGDP